MTLYALTPHPLWRLSLVASLGAVASLILTGCPPEQPSPSPSVAVSLAASPIAASAAPSAQRERVSVDTSQYHITAIKPQDGAYDPKTDTLTAIGMGMPPSGAKNPAQARLMATRAAKTVAMGNILKNYAALIGKSVPEGQIQGFLAQVREVSTIRQADGKVMVKVEVKTGDVRLD